MVAQTNTAYCDTDSGTQYCLSGYTVISSRTLLGGMDVLTLVQRTPT